MVAWCPYKIFMFVCIQCVVLSSIFLRVLSVGVDGLMKSVCLLTCLIIPGGNVVVDMAWSSICL